MSARKPTYVPESRRGQADTTVEREGDEPVRAGLQMVARTTTEVEIATASDDAMPVDTPEIPAVPETLEQRAMRELMITAENGGLEVNQHDDMVIGLQDDTLNLRDMPADETDAYRRDVLTRPEVVSRICSPCYTILITLHYSQVWTIIQRSRSMRLVKRCSEGWDGNRMPREPVPGYMFRKDDRKVLVWARRRVPRQSMTRGKRQSVKRTQRVGVEEDMCRSLSGKG